MTMPTERCACCACRITSRSRAPSRGSEWGAYMVMYALLGVAIFGMAAVVLDFAALRQGRRADRAAADLAATAGAGVLDPLDASTFPAACDAAWAYVVLNRDDADGPVSPPDCASTFSSPTCDPTTSATASGTYGPLTVSITYPVPDADDLMRSEVQGGDPPQAVIASRDGASCERLAVRVQRTRSHLLAGIVGSDTATTDVHAVARKTVQPSTDYPAVVALEPTGCDAVNASVMPLSIVPLGPNEPDTLVVDTDLSTCPAGNAIVATVPGGVTAGAIEAFALSGSAGARTATGVVVPAPTAVTSRLGQGFLDLRYNCAGPCGQALGELDALRAAHGGAGAGGLPTYATCTIPNGAVLAAAGDVYVDCDVFQVDGSFTFTGSTIVFKGDVTVGSSGCLALNDAGCGSPIAIVPPLNAVTTVVRGNLTKLDRGDLVLTNVFALVNGAVAFPRGSTDPLATSRVSWTAPQTGDFEDLLLWTDNAADVVLGEQRTQLFEGTAAAPNATIVLETKAAGAGLYQAQLVGRRIETRGGDPAVVSPSAGRATGRVARLVRLIR